MSFVRESEVALSPLSRKTMNNAFKQTEKYGRTMGAE
jgi:hypothetical protein